MIRTRFAPSPTGYLHIGGARTALFCWAYARRHGGKFILRIEDTDLERSTQQSVQAILDSMQWLGLDCDEGPFYQMQRLQRYREVAEQLIEEGRAYRCYCSREELEAMREAQRARGEKPRYDGRWRDSKAKPPAGVPPVIRFRNPLAGDVAWDDLVKGPITVSNGELDDLVILRADGVPTYNFGVVVDDIDMDITHVIRGDDHVNNTPRQINIYRALGAALPKFAHLPMILGGDGERLSKRHGAVSVMQYRDDGFLPEALVNYLARLGWSHGNKEMFTREELVAWFDLEHISKSPARFDIEKLKWLNLHYIRGTPDKNLVPLVELELRKLGVSLDDGPALELVVALFKDRALTTRHLAEDARIFYEYDPPSAALAGAHLTEAVRSALRLLIGQLSEIVSWDRVSIGAAIKATLTASGLKMPQLAIPLRVILTGRTQTPSIDATLELIGREAVLSRMRRELDAWPT